MNEINTVTRPLDHYWFTLNLFLARNYVLLAALVVALIIWIVLQRRLINFLQHQMSGHSLNLCKAQAGLKQIGEQNLELEAKNKLNQTQLNYWLNIFTKLDNYQAIAGHGKVRKATGYVPDPTHAGKKHLGKKHNVFDPMPPCSPKVEMVDAEHEEVIILTYHTGAEKFSVFIVRPTEIDQIADRALAQIDVWGTREGYTFDIPKSRRGTGALSLALDYVIAYVTRNGAQSLQGKLIIPTDEAHRIRLCCFYAHKYQFEYRAEDGYIIKTLK